MALFGVCSFAGAYATSPFQIVVLRFLIGLGTGGATPTLLALAAEYSPMRLRGAVMTGVLLGLPAGAMLGSLVASAWLPTLGWQGIFMLGGALPTALLMLSFFLLPESPQLLAAKAPSETSRVSGTSWKRSSRSRFRRMLSSPRRRSRPRRGRSARSSYPNIG